MSLASGNLIAAVRTGRPYLPLLNPPRPNRLARGAACLALAMALDACSLNKIAVNKLGNALAGSGGAFSSDNDPELIKQAAPFSLKLMEAVLASNPRHAGLLLACCSGFTQYAYAFVQEEADELEDKDIDAATALRHRARLLYLRSRDYGLRGLDLAAHGFSARIRQNPGEAVRLIGAKEVPFLYWTAVSWAAAISVSKDDPELVSELPVVDSLIDRALALNESFSSGSIHSFLISYELSRRSVPGDPVGRARIHFERAVDLTQGQMAGPFVAWAEGVSLQKQNQPEFELMLRRALAINADARPETRLLNLVLQRRAQWLLSRTNDLFLTKNPGPEPNH